MAGRVEEDYFNWLCAKVQDRHVRLYTDLLMVLHGTEFVWDHPGDRSRAEDGTELRFAFMTEARSDPDPSWETTGCSVLEMLIALADRAEFLTDRASRTWFWKMVENLGFGECRHLTEDEVPWVEEVLFDFIWRRFDPNGRGGLFPMRWPKRDQSREEIWHQLCDYIEEEQIA